MKNLILDRKFGESLPQEFYNSKEMFDLDIKYIFNREWIAVGTEVEIPNNGDYITVKIAHNSIIILRDTDGILQAFHNSCRHRGSIICQKQKGKIANLVCPYHSWTYNLKGNLIYASDMGNDFDIKKHNLESVHIESISGIIYICIAKNPPKYMELMKKTMSPYIEKHNLLDCKIAFQSEIIEEGNWKLVMENNRECNHCSVNHPELISSLYDVGFGKTIDNDFIDANNAHIKLWEKCSLPYKEQDYMKKYGFRAVRMPLKKNFLSQTIDGKLASVKSLNYAWKNMYGFGNLSFWTSPNAWNHFMQDHNLIFYVMPISHNRTKVKTIWLVNKDAEEEVDYNIDHLTKVWAKTNNQDRQLVENNQKGINSDSYVKGIYSPITESFVNDYISWYIKTLKTNYLNIKD